MVFVNTEQTTPGLYISSAVYFMLVSHSLSLFPQIERLDFATEVKIKNKALLESS